MNTIRNIMLRFIALTTATLAAAPAVAQTLDHVEYGPRPFYLIGRMEVRPLKDQLQSCQNQEASMSLFSIGHRGAPMQFPEHTVESNRAAALMGAGILECDVTFTELFRDLGARFTPELKSPSVEMPFKGFTQEDYVQKLVDEYVAAGIPASDVWLQSFNLEDVLYWIEAAPEFGAQAVYLMDEYDIESYSPMDASTWPNTMEELKAMGVNYIAPPTWMLATLENGEIVPSELAIQAKAADLNIITWTIERSGPLVNGGGVVLSAHRRCAEQRRRDV